MSALDDFVTKALKEVRDQKRKKKKDKHLKKQQPSSEPPKKDFDCIPWNDEAVILIKTITKCTCGSYHENTEPFLFILSTRFRKNGSHEVHVRRITYEAHANLYRELPRRLHVREYNVKVCFECFQRENFIDGQDELPFHKDFFAILNPKEENQNV